VIATQAAIAPDGSSIVFSDSVATGLVLKRKLRDASEATVMVGTDGGVAPFFSPDGKWVGYLTLDLKVRKVPASGGGSVTLAEDVGTNYRAAAWLDDNTIVYGASGNVLKRISGDGGAGVLLRGWKASGFSFPASMAPLPGSKAFLLSICRNNCAYDSSILAYSFATDSLIPLVQHAVGTGTLPRAICSTRAATAACSRLGSTRRHDGAHVGSRVGGRGCRSSEVRDVGERCSAVHDGRGDTHPESMVWVNARRACVAVRLDVDRTLRVSGALAGWSLARGQRARPNDRSLDRAE
jgi:hypothetical protein